MCESCYVVVGGRGDFEGSCGVVGIGGMFGVSSGW